MNTFKKEQWIKDISGGDEVRTLVLIHSAAQQQARNGAFWRLEIKDSSGTLEARIWAPHSQKYTDIAAGSVVWLEGRADTFRDQVQVNVTSLQVLGEDELASVDVSALLPSSSRKPELMFDELVALCEQVLQHEPLRRATLKVLHEPVWHTRLLTAPAAKVVHHAWVGGFLEHTLSVVHLCMSFCDQYPFLDRQVLLVGAVFHDFGKLWELSDDFAVGYTNVGRLIGHISLSMEKLEPFLHEAGLEPELILHIKHLILSHHGTREFGSPVLPQTAEAFALHYADNLDAKLVQVQNLFKNIPQCEVNDDTSGVWSSYQPFLERSIYQPPCTPLSALTKIEPLELVTAVATDVMPQCATASPTKLVPEPMPERVLVLQNAPEPMPEAPCVDLDDSAFCEMSLEEHEASSVPPWDDVPMPPLDDASMPPWDEASGPLEKTVSAVISARSLCDQAQDEVVLPKLDDAPLKFKAKKHTSVNSPLDKAKSAKKSDVSASLSDTSVDNANTTTSPEHSKAAQCSLL